LLDADGQRVREWLREPGADAEAGADSASAGRHRA